MLQVDKISYPEDAKTRAEAEEWSLGRRQNATLMEHFREFQEKYAKTDEKLLKKSTSRRRSQDLPR